MAGFLNNRHYLPAYGTFASVDPLVTKTHPPYSYAYGNPIAMSDGSGLCSEWSMQNGVFSCIFRSADVGHTQLNYEQVDDDGDSSTPEKWVPYADEPCRSTGAGDCYVPEPFDPSESPDMTPEEALRLVSDIESSLVDDHPLSDPENWHSGGCGAIDMAFFLAFEVSGCAFSVGNGETAIAPGVGRGLGTPALGASVGTAYANFVDDPDELEGWGVCYGGTVGSISGTICGSIGYDEVTAQWEHTGVTTVFAGYSIGSDLAWPEAHVLYTNTTVWVLNPWDWWPL